MAGMLGLTAAVLPALFTMIATKKSQNAAAGIIQRSQPPVGETLPRLRLLVQTPIGRDAVGEVIRQRRECGIRQRRQHVIQQPVEFPRPRVPATALRPL